MKIWTLGHMMCLRSPPYTVRQYKRLKNVSTRISIEERVISIKKEEKDLSKWLNKSEEALKSFYGQPDKVEFLKTRNRNYVYITEKYKIKCERKFEVNPRNIVVGFSSKNCF